LIIYLPYLIVYQQNKGFDFREVLQPNQSTQKEKKLLAECKKLFKIGNSYLRAFLKTVHFFSLIPSLLSEESGVFRISREG
jgi:hypothetical protein